MPLETGTYISDLTVTNPAHTDGLNNADGHLRLIKSALKTTFPSITGAVTATHTQLNSAVSLLTVGTGILADTGAFFATNIYDGFQNPTQGLVVITATNTGDTATNAVATFNGHTLAVSFAGAISTVGNAAVGGNATVAGTLAVTGVITGIGMVPIGGTVIWWDDALPAEGGWAWANGQVISSATTVCPILLARWGSKFGGNGTTTMGVPDMQGVVPVGKDTMGGAAGNSLLTSILSGVKGVINSIFGTDTTTLTAAQIPPVTFSGTTGNDSPDHTHPYTAPIFSANQTGGGQFPEDSNTAGGATGGASNRHQHPFSGAINGGGGAHTNLQPSKVVNYIIRLG